MKKRKLLIGGVVVALLGSGLAYAGHKHRGGMFGHGGHLMHMIDKMEHRLDLNNDQVEQLEQIAFDSRPVMKQMRAQRMEIGIGVAALDPAAGSYDTEIAGIAEEVAEMARQSALSIGAAYKQASAVLNAEQRAELQQTIQKRVERMTRRANRKG